MRALQIRHPYIVCLRYAFQSEEKLYLITDYYSGGSLFYHLRKVAGAGLGPSPLLPPSARFLLHFKRAGL